MDGLVDKALEGRVVSAQGGATWPHVMDEAGAEREEFPAEWEGAGSA